MVRYLIFAFHSFNSVFTFRMKFLKFSIVLSLTLLLGLSCPIKREIKTFLGVEKTSLLESTLKPNQSVNCVNYHAAKKVDQSTEKQQSKFPSRLHATISFNPKNDLLLSSVVNGKKVAYRLPIYILHEQYRL